MEEEFEPKKLQEAKKCKVKSNNSTKIQINEVTQSHCAKLKLIKFSLDSDDEDNPDSPPCKQTNISKIVAHAEEKTIVEESQKTEDLIENSEIVLINTKKHKRKLDLLSKKSHYGNENVNMSLKISDISIDNDMNFDDFENVKSISHSSKRKKYSNEQNSSKSITSDMHPFFNKQYDSNDENTPKKKNHAEIINNCENANEMPSISGYESPRKKNKIKLFHQDSNSYEKMHSPTLNSVLDLGNSNETLGNINFDALLPISHSNITETNYVKTKKKKKKNFHSNRELLSDSNKRIENEKNENSRDESFFSGQATSYILNDSVNQSNNNKKTEKQELVKESSTISTRWNQSLNASSIKLNNLRAGKGKKTSHGVERIIEEVIEQSILNDQTVNALRNLNIIIDWVLPISHKLDSGSHNLSRMKNAIEKALSKEGLVWKNKVYYSNEECEIIQRNWEEFSLLYGFEDPKVFFRSKQYVSACKYSERLKFKQFLAKGLPERPLYSVYHKFIELYAYPVKGKWNEKEDMILVAINNAEYKEEILRRHIVICKALDRNWMAVYRRLKLLECNGEIRERAKPVEWSSSLMINLLENLLEMTNSSHIEDLKHADISHNIWNRLGHEMDISGVRLKTFWCERFYAQLFASQPIRRNALRIELIEWLYNSHYNTWNELSWDEISARFYDVGKLFLYIRFRKIVQGKVPKDKWGDFRECINYLYHNFLPELKSGNKREKVLTRLKYCPERHTLEEIEESLVEDLSETGNFVNYEDDIDIFNSSSNRGKIEKIVKKSKKIKNSFQTKLDFVKTKLHKKSLNDKEEHGVEEYENVEKEQNIIEHISVETKQDIMEENFVNDAQYLNNKRIQYKQLEFKQSSTNLKNEDELCTSVDDNCIKNEISKNKKSKKIQSNNIDTSYPEDKKNLTVSIQEHMYGMYTSNQERKKNKKQHHEKDEDKVSNFIAVKKSEKENQNDVEKYMSYENDELTGQLSDTLRKSNKKKRRIWKISDNQDQNIYEAKNIDERVMFSQDENNIIIKNSKRNQSKHESLEERCSDKEDANIFDRREELNIDNTSKKLRKKKNRYTNESYANEEDNSIQKEEIIETDTFKKSGKIKHIIIKDNQNKPEMIQFKTTENNYIDGLFSQENYIVPFRSSKKSSKKKQKDEDLYSNLEEGHILPSKKKHRNMEEWFSDKGEQLLEEVEDKNLYHASELSSIKNQQNLEESNTEMDYTLFRKSKDINATSTVRKKKS